MNGYPYLRSVPSTIKQLYIQSTENDKTWKNFPFYAKIFGSVADKDKMICKYDSTIFRPSRYNHMAPIAPFEWLKI